VRGVSLEVGEGEWLAVTGPNGCGKSSLALAAAGLWPAERGSVAVAGRVVSAAPGRRAEARIAAVLQEPATQLLEGTVAGEVAFAARNLGIPEDAIAGAVRRWGERLCVSGWLSRDPRALSAGEQQLVLIAAALASGPRILVADEGTAHMDSASRARALETIAEERARGLAILWVTQAPEELARADRVLRLAALPEALSAGEPVAVPSGGPPFRASADPAPGGASPAGPSAPAGPSGLRDRPRLRVEMRPPAGEGGPRVSLGEPVCFGVGPGRPVALTGPNGAGKTLALEAIAGVSSHPQISISWEGIPAHPPVLAAQYPELQIFAETVEEELAFGPTERGIGGASGVELGMELLSRMGFRRQILGRATWALSAGERRMVQIAAALSTPASVIALDEPTCGLDPFRVGALTRLLAELSGGVGLAVGTQDSSLVRSLGAREITVG